MTRHEVVCLIGGLCIALSLATSFLYLWLHERLCQMLQTVLLKLQEGEDLEEIMGCDHPGCKAMATHYRSVWVNPEHMKVENYCPEHAPADADPFDEEADDPPDPTPREEKVDGD